MAVSKALKRLLRIRDLEEEQHRLALEAAAGNLRRWERARDGALATERHGNDLVRASVETGEAADRHAGLAEAMSARRKANMLAPRVAAAEMENMQLRALLLEKRVERRQAETLIEETEARDAVEENRRSQQTIDDWFGTRQSRRQGMGKPRE